MAFTVRLPRCPPLLAPPQQRPLRRRKQDNQSQKPLLIQLSRSDGGQLANMKMRLLLLRRGQVPTDPEYNLRKRGPDSELLCRLRPAAYVAECDNVLVVAPKDVTAADEAFPSRRRASVRIKSLEYQIAVEPSECYAFGCSEAATRIFSPPFAIKARRREKDVVVPYKGVSRNLGEMLSGSHGCTVVQWINTLPPASSYASTVPLSAAQTSPAQHSAAQHGAAQHSAAHWHGAAQRRAAQHRAALWQGAAQHSAGKRAYSD